MKAVKVVLLGSDGKHREVVVPTEEELVELLRATYKTEAPIEIGYSDGTSLDQETMDRIQRKAFAGFAPPR